MTTESTRHRPIPARRAWCAAALASALLAHPAAQAPQTPKSPAFEVASVKPNRSGEPFIRFGMQPGGRFSALNVPLRELIRFAYNVQPFQIDGGPGWINTDRFDVTAKAEGDAAQVGPGQMGSIQLMMQNLLAERFGLKIRRESKEMPTYALVVARSDGKLGSKIEPSAVDCAALARDRAAGAATGPPPPPPQFTPGKRPECGMFAGPNFVSAGGVSMYQLAQFLSNPVRRMVQDKTGLSGSYAFDLTFTPDQLPPGAPLNGGPVPIDPNGPSLFTALQEQLGLKLDAQRAPVDMLFIEGASQPTPD